MAALFGLGSSERSTERLLNRKGYSELGCGSSNGEDERLTRGCGCLSPLTNGMIRSWNGVKDISFKLYEMGRTDPRKLLFATKMGLALALVSVIIFFMEPLHRASQYSVWAILTVVVVFEYSVGATLNKGFNRALGTFSAGGLAMGLATLFMLSRGLKEIYIVIGIFITGFCASYVKLYPPMKPYEYGFRVFLLTYCIVMVSASSSSSPFKTAFYRLMLIAFGAVVALVINTCVCPIWAGEDLHKSVVKNFEGLASSLEGCVNGYIQCLEYERIPSKILTYQASDDPVYDGYRSAVQSSTREESLVLCLKSHLRNLFMSIFCKVRALSFERLIYLFSCVAQLEFAIWEPPHGPYRSFKYPWINYVKVSGALRHCAFMVMAMHGCILSEIQAPQEKRRVFGNELRRVGIEGAKVLRELGNKVAKMEKLSQGDLLLQVHEAAQQLQMKIDQKSYLLVNAESWESGRLPRDYEDPQNFQDNNLRTKSLREQGLNVRSVPLISPSLSELASPRTVSGRDVRWPSPFSPNAEAMFAEHEARTYESASSLSLATFASLLIEFVARLQNLVDSFEELSVVAKFREPVQDAPADKEGGGFWRRLVRRFWFKKPSNETVILRNQDDMV